MEKELAAALALYNAVKPKDFAEITPEDRKAMLRDMGTEARLLRYIVGMTYDGLAYGNWLERR
jgi:hypothetical protein